MKKLLVIGVLACAAVALADEAAMSLADARGQLAASAENSSTLSSVMAKLSPADQVTFLSEVNAAIAEMPASADEKTALYLNANKAAMKASKKNLKDLLATTYSTVPAQSLTVINEDFAANVVSRGTLSDESYTKLAGEVMDAVAAVNNGNDNAAVADTFALLMLVRASNGSPADLAETLASKLPAASQDMAKSEWIPPALSTPADYEPMLGAADAGEAPDAASVLAIAGAQGLVATMADVAKPFSNKAADFSVTEGAPEMGADNGLYRIPRTTNPELRYYNAAKASGDGYGASRGSDAASRSGGRRHPSRY